MTLRSLLPFALLLLASGGVGCSVAKDDGAAVDESAVSGVPIGQVRGVVDVSNTIRTRLLDEAAPSSQAFDVSRVAGAVFNLRRQLGVFADEGSSTTYQGGLPTPLRTTLWHQIFGRTATAVGNVCTGSGAALTFDVYAFTAGPGGTFTAPTTFLLHPAVAAKIRAVCAFEGDEATRRRAAGALFDAVMGHGSTLAAERAAFLAEFAADGAPALAATPAARVTDMMLAMLLNPHFLLSK
jgi:hypothetical protein